MNKRRQFTEEFKQEAANQVIERGYPIREVADHLGISSKTLYNWVWNQGNTGMLEKNRWYAIEQHVKLNDPGKRNGRLPAWINGKFVFDRRELRFRETLDLKIEEVWFNVYHGGRIPAPRNETLYIDNIVSLQSI